MKKLNSDFCVDQMARVLGVSRSGYYDFIKRAPSLRVVERKNLLAKIKIVFKASHETYGSPRIHAELRSEGVFCSRRRVAKIMKARNLQAKMYRKFKKTTQPAQKPYYRGQDLVKQYFSTSQPNKVWVTDITYLRVQKKWVYLAVILDLYSRKVVGMALKDHMRTSLILEALTLALVLRKPPSGLIHHSDLGGQYTSQALVQLSQRHGIRLSHGKTGCAYDNAAMESFFHTLKTELVVYFKTYQTLEEAKMDIFTYIFTFYNQKKETCHITVSNP